MPCGHDSDAGRRQAPSRKVVPCGQQLGGVPTGRSEGHVRGFGVSSFLPGGSRGSLLPPPDAGARHAPLVKTVPTGQQLGGVPMGLSRGHLSGSREVFVPPPSAGFSGRCSGGGWGRVSVHARPFQTRLGGQVQRPAAVTTMPPRHEDSAGGFGAGAVGATVTVWQADDSVADASPEGAVPVAVAIPRPTSLDAAAETIAQLVKDAAEASAGSRTVIVQCLCWPTLSG
jgi:hypothetical protein